MQQPMRDPYKLVGTVLDRYRIQEIAGMGGMGVVYRAQHEITKGAVAIKILRPDYSLKEQDVSYFFEEAAKTVTLNHPSIIKVTSADQTADGCAFMVMEWLDGRTLDQELKQHGVLSLARIVALLDLICDAVAYAHNKGIIHRDLKPSNIMLIANENGGESAGEPAGENDGETIRILDFGIAKALSSTVGTNTRVAGSSLYISPEQTVAKSSIDRRADIYSLGVMLYQLLTGKVPFEADTDGQVIDMHRLIAPASLREIRPEIPLAVEEVVFKAMAKRPIDRYQSATDMARAFRQAANLGLGTMVLQCADIEDNSPVANAMVYLNGRHAGQTSDDGSWRQGDLMPRQYLIEIEGARYMRWHLSQRVEADHELMIPAKLKRDPKGELIVLCGVPNAEVEVDGVVIGRTDQTGRLYLESLAAGTHTVKLTHPQFLPVESAVEIAVWQQAFADLPMTQRPRRELGKLFRRKVDSLKVRLTTRFKSVPIIEQNLPSAATEAIAENDTATRNNSSAIKEQAERPQPIGAERTCHKCGARITPGLKFCTECGARLVEIEAIVPQALSRVVEPELKTGQFFDVLSTQPLIELSGKEAKGEATAALPSKETQFQDTASSARQASLRSRRPLMIGLATIVLAALAAGAWAIFSVRNETFPLSIVTAPPHSRVLIDGKTDQTTDEEGRTQVNGLNQGEHSITISHEGYREQTFDLTLPLAQPLGTYKLELVIPADMALIPGGTFTMGRDDAKPTDADFGAHQITVPPFFIDKYEVTNAGYRTCVKAGRCQAPMGWENGEFSQGLDDYPVVNVTWDQAESYAKWAGKRLPAEAEWEFVARGGERQWLRPWEGNFDKTKANLEGKELAKAVSYPDGAGPFGVFNLLGNVWEWVNDDFKLYKGSRYQVSGCSRCKVIRGGSYSQESNVITATYRREWDPSNATEGYLFTGFRCAKNFPVQ